MPGSRNTLPFTTISFDEQKNHITILDQTRLPDEETYVPLTTTDDVFRAIKTMQVRGAPLIGVTAAYGIAMAAYGARPDEVVRTADFIATARPTAVNLAWAVERMKQRRNGRADLVQEARAIEHEDKQACCDIGNHGADLLRGNTAVMVHCNAGALATSGIGTALGIIYTAVARGMKIYVYATETRPLLQGARLTAWELTRSNIDTCVICDSMTATFMPSVSAVIVGADRIATNGDTANKIGTFNLAIIARHFKVPFYVAAPLSSFDPNCRLGANITIEQRSEQEIRVFNGREIVPEAARVNNPAFDITPAELISAFVSEHGIIYPPYCDTIPEILTRDTRGDD